MDRIERERGPSGYLVGDSFTVADLTAAAILSPLVRPPEFPTTVVDPARDPEDLKRWRATRSPSGRRSSTCSRCTRATGARAPRSSACRQPGPPRRPPARRPARASRCAKYTGIIESRITITATTFTIGTWFAAHVRVDPDRERLLGAGCERGDDDLVERQREREQRAREHRRTQGRQRDEAEVFATCPPQGRRTPSSSDPPSLRNRAIMLL